VGDGQIDFVCKVEVDTMRVSFPVCQCQWRWSAMNFDVKLSLA
jgi:hypothetical protein